MNNYTMKSLTTEQFASALTGPDPVVILFPVGSLEPHGPHLGLMTDTIISEACAEQAAIALEKRGFRPFIAPSLPYGVTDYAQGFKGAVSIPETVLVEYLAAVTRGFLDNGVAHVCLINNHLEPDHYQAILKTQRLFNVNECSVACPLKRRWARTLSDEFKRGECHAGQYETAIIMAAEPAGVHSEIQKRLPEIPISLSDKINEGVTNFTDMGMSSAYAGAPAKASIEEGTQLIQKLAEMVTTEIIEALSTEESN